MPYSLRVAHPVVARIRTLPEWLQPLVKEQMELFAEHPDWGTPMHAVIANTWWYTCSFPSPDHFEPCSVAWAYQISQDETIIFITDLNHVPFDPIM